MDNSRLLGDIAQSPLFVISTSDTVGKTLELAKAKKVHHFPVRRKTNLVGFVCVCDMLDASEDTLIELVMTPDATTLPEDATAHDAAVEMKRTGRGSVLITNEDGVYGIVTRADVVAWDADSEEILSERCDCCGLREHLRKLESRTLCAFCEDSTTERDWLTQAHPA